MVSVISRKRLQYCFKVPLQKIWKETSPENSSSESFFFSVEFSQNRHKEQLKLNSSEQITKDVKQVLQRKGGGTEVAMELLRKTK